MNNPVAFIAGAGDYIGSAVAKKFAREGYLVCLARHSGEKLETTTNEILAEGGEAYGYAMDARDEDGVIDCFANIENTHGPVNFVLHNIGGNVNFPIQETTARVFRKVWEMACLSGFLVGREAAKYMVPRSSGSIFFTGATASIRGGSGYTAFAAGQDPDSLPTGTLMNPASIGDTYWFLHGQSKDAWTLELDLRPFAEKF